MLPAALLMLRARVLLGLLLGVQLPQAQGNEGEGVPGAELRPVKGGRADKAGTVMRGCMTVMCIQD